MGPVKLINEWPLSPMGKPLRCGAVDAKMFGIAPQSTFNPYCFPRWVRTSHTDYSIPLELAQAPP